MKNLYPISLVLCLACVSYAAPPATTAASAAPKRLQDAAAFLRNARSYRFATQTSLGLRPDARPSKLDAAVRLPDRLRVHRAFMGGIDYYFDGKTLTVFSVDDKRYGSMEAPATIAALLEAEKQRGARLVSGLRFFTFLAHPDHVIWSLPDWRASADQTLGSSRCQVFRADVPDLGLMELWIDSGPQPLVRRIIRKSSGVTDIEWEIPADLPDKVFVLTPPPGAVEVKAPKVPTTASSAPATPPAAPRDVLPRAAAFLREAGSYRLSVQTNPGTDPTTRPQAYAPDVACSVRLPDRLHVALYRRGGAPAQCYYNGKTLSAYSPSSQQAMVEDAPPTIAAVVDPKRRSEIMLGSYLGHLTFLMSPDDPMWSLPDWTSAGMQKLEGTECQVFRATQANGRAVEIWLQTGPRPLVRKVNRGKPVDLNWEIPVDLPDKHFEFVAPPGVTTTRAATQPAGVASNGCPTAYEAAFMFLELLQMREGRPLPTVIAPGKDGTPEERAKLTLQRKGRLGGVMAALEGGAKLSIGEARPGKPEDGREVARVFVDAVDPRTKNGQLRKNVAVLDVVRCEDGWRVDDWTSLVPAK